MVLVKDFLSLWLVRFRTRAVEGNRHGLNKEVGSCPATYLAARHRHVL